MTMLESGISQRNLTVGVVTPCPAVEMNLLVSSVAVETLILIVDRNSTSTGIVKLAKPVW